MVRALVWHEFGLAFGFRLWHSAGMPKRIKHTKRPKDVNQLAHRLVELSTAEPEAPQEIAPAPPTNISEYMAAIGRKGGQIGGKRRLTTMTAKKRKNIAIKAARARWNKAPKP